MIRGTFDEFSVGEIIRLIHATNKTGLLHVYGHEGTGTISFEDGEICAAGTSLSSEPLGRRLVRRGHLPEVELGAALEGLEGNNVRLGEFLVAAGVVRRDDVRSALEEQVHDGVLDVLRLRPTEFLWKHEHPARIATPGTEQILVAATERLAQLERIYERFPDDVAVTLSPVPDPSAAEIRLTAEDWRVIALLGTRRSLRDVLRYSPGGDTRALFALDRLMKRGLVEVLTDYGGSDSPPAMASDSSVIDEARATATGAGLGEVIPWNATSRLRGGPNEMDLPERSGQL